MPTAQLNARIDVAEKMAGDAVLARHGVSATQVIRDTWRYMAEHQRLPHYMNDGMRVSDERAELCGRVDAGAGMALRLASEAGIRAELEAMTYAELRETAFEEMLAERAEAHV